MVFVSRVTAPVRARSRPWTVAPVVAVTDCCARTVPWNCAPVPMVAELPTCQNTLQELAPPVIVIRVPDPMVSVDAAGTPRRSPHCPRGSTRRCRRAAALRRSRHQGSKTTRSVRSPGPCRCERRRDVVRGGGVLLRLRSGGIGLMHGAVDDPVRCSTEAGDRRARGHTEITVHHGRAGVRHGAGTEDTVRCRGTRSTGPSITVAADAADVVTATSDAAKPMPVNAISAGRKKTGRGHGRPLSERERHKERIDDARMISTVSGVCAFLGTRSGIRPELPGNDSPWRGPRPTRGRDTALVD